MTDTELLESILEELKALRQQGNENTLWTVTDIARHLSVSTNTVYNRVICQSGFPEPLNIEGLSRRWKAKDVILWCTRMPKKVGRPRKQLA